MYHVQALRVGPSHFPNFVYSISDPTTKDAVLIDPAWDPHLILEAIASHQLTLRAILLTHSHSDHVDAVEAILNNSPVPVYMSREEIEFSRFSVKGLTRCKHDEQIQAGSIVVTPLNTPGHTVGSVCYLSNGFVFTGDTLFIEGCGHCNAPGASPSAMFSTIQYIKSRISDTTLVYPGHRYTRDPGLTMGEVKKKNIYFHIAEEGAFIDFCMRRARKP